MKHLVLALALAVPPAGALAQTPAPASASKPASPPSSSPFQEDEDLRIMERAKEEARLKAEAEAAAAAKAKEDARRMAIQTAMAPIKILARGKQGDRAVVLLALDATRRVTIALNEPMTLNTAAGAVEMRLTKVTRQTLTFELSDGTILPLQ